MLQSWNNWFHNFTVTYTVCRFLWGKNGAKRCSSTQEQTYRWRSDADHGRCTCLSHASQSIQSYVQKIFAPWTVTPSEKNPTAMSPKCSLYSRHSEKKSRVAVHAVYCTITNSIPVYEVNYSCVNLIRWWQQRLRPQEIVASAQPWVSVVNNLCDIGRPQNTSHIYYLYSFYRQTVLLKRGVCCLCLSVRNSPVLCLSIFKLDASSIHCSRIKHISIG